jgi:hypothetical protein
MLPGIGRLGAGSCTIFSQRRQDFLMRAIWTTFVCAAIMSRSSLTSSPIAPEVRDKLCTPLACHVNRRHSRDSMYQDQAPVVHARVASQTRGRRRKAGAEGSSGMGSPALHQWPHHRLRPRQPAGLRAPVPVARSRVQSFTRIYRKPVSATWRSASEGPEPIDHGPAASPGSWRFQPVITRSSASTQRGHWRGFQQVSTCA